MERRVEPHEQPAVQTEPKAPGPGRLEEMHLVPASGRIPGLDPRPFDVEPPDPAGPLAPERRLAEPVPGVKDDFDG